MQYNLISAWGDACFVVFQPFFSQTHEEKRETCPTLLKSSLFFDGGADMHDRFLSGVCHYSQGSPQHIASSLAGRKKQNI
jgi:hypothetical protein